MVFKRASVPGAGVAQSVLDPRRTFSCLTVVLRVFTSPLLPALRPRLHEGAAELLYRLAAAPGTQEPALDLLRREAALLAPLDLVCQPLPKQVCSLSGLGRPRADRTGSACGCLWPSVMRHVHREIRSEMAQLSSLVARERLSAQASAGLAQIVGYLSLDLLERPQRPLVGCRV